MQPTQAVLSPAVPPSLPPAACTHPRAAPPRTGHASPPAPVPPFALLLRWGPGPCSQARRSAAPAPRTASIAGTAGMAGTAPPQGLPGRVVHAGPGRPALLPAAQPATLPGGAAAWGAAQGHPGHEGCNPRDSQGWRAPRSCLTGPQAPPGAGSGDVGALQRPALCRSSPSHAPVLCLWPLGCHHGGRWRCWGCGVGAARCPHAPLWPLVPWQGCPGSPGGTRPPAPLSCGSAGRPASLHAQRRVFNGNCCRHAADRKGSG